jgi:hypothetical protein
VKNGYVVGIDPGFTGGLVFVKAAIGGPIILDAVDMPVRGEGKQTEINVEEIHKWLEETFKFPVYLEFPTARPGEGAQRSFRFGHGVGMVEATAIAMRRNVVAGKRNPEGRSAEEAVTQLYGEGLEKLKGPRGGWKSGRVDAALVAYWGLVHG